MPPLEKMAQLLGGEVLGDQVLCPGPGHSSEDRSLAVKPDANADGGFITHSFSNNTAIESRDYVRKKLGLPAFEPRAKGNGSGKPWTFVREHVYRTATGAPHTRKKKMLDANGKKQFPQEHWDGRQWAKGIPKDWPKLPYRLPELLKAPDTSIVYVTEGERDADTLAGMGFVATTAGGVSSAWTPEMVAHFKDRRVVIFVDADQQGREYGNKVAHALDAVAQNIKLVDLFPSRNDGSDVSDFIATDRVGVKLLKMVNDAPQWEPSADAGKDTTGDDALLAELAALPRLQYERRREHAAEQLGIRVSVLDKLVEAERGKSEEESEEASPALYEHWLVKSSDEAVDGGGTLLQAVKEAIQRYVFMSEDLAIAATLWIVLSWLHEHEGITHSPILYVTSAEKDSGKSTLLGVINFLARRSLQSVDISGPALFRSIATWTPTLIVDEADDALSDNADLRSVINSGWTKGQGVIRCHPDTREPELYSTFAPKVVGMKGRNLPDTTLSRAIIINMKPRRPDDPKENTADFSHTDNDIFIRLRSQLARWTADNAEAVTKAEPEIPALGPPDGEASLAGRRSSPDPTHDDPGHYGNGDVRAWCC
jgi:5S rRNA maturation endonuclease (ribonuclease M5)